jgi:hypothetical protein
LAATSPPIVHIVNYNNPIQTTLCRLTARICPVIVADWTALDAEGYTEKYANMENIQDRVTEHFGGSQEPQCATQQQKFRTTRIGIRTLLERLKFQR